MDQTNLLLITYSFPPLGGIGVQRALSLAKYLPSEGFRVDVLTARNAAAVGRDEKLLRQVPDSVTVHRTLAPELPFAMRKRLKGILTGGSKENGAAAPEPEAGPSAPPSGLKSLLTQSWMRLMCPDPQVFWMRPALRRAIRVIEERQITTVLVTAPPFSVFLIGNALKRRFPHLHLITDFRDEWLTYYLHTLSVNRSEYLLRESARIERETIERSDRVVAVTSTALEEIRKRYPEQPAAKFQLVPNGYEPESFAGFTPRAREDNKVVLSYMGTIYPPTPPATFLDALQGLPAGLREKLECRFIGRIESLSDRRRLESDPAVIRLYPFMPQREAVHILEETDYLLLLWNDHINVPGKLFEYLALGRPIIALAQPDGEVWRLIHQTQAGWCVDIHNPSAIRALLQQVADGSLLASQRYAPHRDRIQQYERKRLASAYGQMIHQLDGEKVTT